MAQVELRSVRHISCEPKKGLAEATYLICLQQWPIQMPLGNAKVGQNRGKAFLLVCSIWWLSIRLRHSLQENAEGRPRDNHVAAAWA